MAECSFPLAAERLDLIDSFSRERERVSDIIVVNERYSLSHFRQLIRNTPAREQARRRTVISLLMAAVALGGCQASKKPAAEPKAGHTFATTPDTSSAIIANTDPSAMNLQDMSGAILMYYALHKRLPDRLDQIVPLADAPVSLTVPGTDKKYLYTPDGFLMQDRESRILVFEPAPMHSGHRLAITMSEPKPDVTTSCKVIALPESVFLLRPPDSTQEAPAQAESQQPVLPPPPKDGVRPRSGFGNRR